MQQLKFFLMKLFLSLKHFFSNVEPEIQTAIIDTCNVVEIVKTWTDTHEAMIKFIEGVLPSRIGDIIIQKVLDILAKIPTGYTTLTGDEKSLFLHGLAIQIGLVMANGKLHFSDAVHLLEWYFQNHKHGAINPPAKLLADVTPTPEEQHAAEVKRIADVHAGN